MEQVTEMLKLTRETLANSSDDQRQSKVAERSDSAQCLGTIAALLRSYMPHEDMGGGTTGPAPSNNRDYCMTEGASASQSHFLQEGAVCLLPSRRSGEPPVDRTGRGVLEEETRTPQSRPRSRSGSFTSQFSSSDVPHSSQHNKFSPPALVLVVSSDEEGADPETGKTLVDDWLEVDMREASRKRQRERLPSTGTSSMSKRLRSSGGEGRAVRTATLRPSSLRPCTTVKGLARQDSFEHMRGEGSDLSFPSDRLSPPSCTTPPPPVANSPLSRGPSREIIPAPPPGPSHMRVRVTIEHKTFLIPCPVFSSPAPSFAWLADEASSRYGNQMGRRPRLSLTTQDGAQLCPEDLLADVLGHNEEVVGVVEGWDLPPLSEQYKACCKKADQSETCVPRTSGLCSARHSPLSSLPSPLPSSPPPLPPLQPHIQRCLVCSRTQLWCACQLFVCPKLPFFPSCSVSEHASP